MLEGIFHIGRHVFLDTGILHTDRRGIAPLGFPAILLPGRAVHGNSRSRFRFRLDQGRQCLPKRLACIRQGDPILRPLRTREARFHSRQIERKQLGILRLRSLLIMKQPLLARIRFDQRDLLFRAPG